MSAGRSAGWRRIWSGKATGATLPPAGDERLRQLLRLDGYDSPTATLDLAAFRALVDHLAARLALAPGDSVFEVGCGAGAVLHELQARGARVSGLDYAEPLVVLARQALPGADVLCLDAAECPAHPRADHVISVGAFLYLEDERHAMAALARMMAKARRHVAVVDVNDAARREAALAARREAHGGEPPGPAQLFLDRHWFAAAAPGWTVAFEDCTVAASRNSGYRYNVFMTRMQPAEP